MTSPLRIGLRVDASEAISLGHLTRCLTLADALKKRGADALFLCAPGAAPWRAMIEARGHRVAMLSAIADAPAVDEDPDPLAHAAWLPRGWRADAEAALGTLGEEPPLDWLIVDHYALDAQWERRLRAAAPRIMAIDDLADRLHDCDILLDHNAEDETKRRYETLAPAARRLLGPRYALLRPQFAEATPRVRKGPVERILVFMSAVDPKGATLRALDALSQSALAAIEIDVVIGAASPHRAAIEAAAAERGRAIVHVDVADMAALCDAADLAIGAGGVAALERCRLGLPSLALAIAANQETGLAALQAAGAVRHLGRLEAWTPAALAQAIGALMGDAAARTAISVNASKLVDGAGAARCADLLIETARPMTLRPAALSDARSLYNWRNDETVRRLSLNNAAIVWDDHVAWLTTKLREPDHFHWIVERSGAPCGAVRFDVADGAARVSIVIAPERRGAGLGALVLAEGEKRLLAARSDVKRFVADIRPENRASQRLFAAAGYHAVGAESSDTVRVAKFAQSDLA
jgi:UDP-2,4-diacetamido-2,4,6-trideoxy-beta-L-altropyranose hydrolase